MFCVKAMHDIWLKHNKDLALRLQQQSEAASVDKADYRIAPNEAQFSLWDTWTRKEQIANSYATDEESAKKKLRFMSDSMFLRLKKE
jgi:hypothetical protein